LIHALQIYGLKLIKDNAEEGELYLEEGVLRGNWNSRHFFRCSLGKTGCELEEEINAEFLVKTRELRVTLLKKIK
jgi:hypothetical protein